MAKLQKPFQWEKLNQCIWLIMGLPLLIEMNKSDIFVFSFDENLNQVTQTCEMDVYIRFWKVTELKVNVPLIGSTMEHIKIYQSIS